MFDRFGNAVGQLAGTVETLSGELGYTLKGVFRVVDPDDPRKFFVRFPNGNWVSAFHYNRVPQKPGMPVLTSTDTLGRPYIIGEDKTKSSVFTPVGQAGNAVGWHTHPRNGGMEYITDTWLLKQKRVAPVAGTLGVTITAGSYSYRRHLKWLTVQTVDLTAYVPSATAAIVWVIVALNPATGVIVVLPGIPYLGDVPADPTGIPLISCLELGYEPLCAIWLQQGDTSIPSFRFEDLRFAVGTTLWFLEDLLNVSGGYASYGYELTYDDGYWIPTAEGSGGGGATSLNDLTDVDTVSTPPTDGQALIFDGASSLWKPGTVAGGGGSSPALIYDYTLPADGTFDTNTADDLGNTGISQLYTDLELRISGIGAAGVTAGVEIFFNGDTNTAHYDGGRSLVNGGSSGGDLNEIGFVGTSGVGLYGSIIADVPGYTLSSIHRTLIARSAVDGGGTSPNFWHYALQHDQAGALTRFQAHCRSAGNFAAGSRLRIYGIP